MYITKRWKIILISINIFFISVTLLTISYAALNRIAVTEFLAINGDFQSYNGFRRLLDGQVPFRDFYWYLGFGPLYLHSFFLTFHNTFASSLFVVKLLVLGSIYLMMQTASFLIIRKFTLSNCIATALFVLTVAFEQYENSLRITRSLAPLMAIVLLSAAVFLLRLTRVEKQIFHSMVYGLLLAPVFLWSNDFGTAAFISFTVLYGSYLLIYQEGSLWSRVKKAIVNGLCYAASFLAGLYAFLMMLTQGNAENWLKFTLGVSDYQSWYYITRLKTVVLTIKDLPLDLSCAIQILFVIYYVVRFVQKKTDRLEMALLFWQLANLTAHYMYVVMSDTYGIPQPFAWSIPVLVAANGIKILTDILKTQRHKKMAVIAVTAICLCVVPVRGYHVISPYISNLAQSKSDLANGNLYVDEHLRYVEKEYLSIQDALDFMGDEPFFSTYASALELKSGTYQPTGIDYIIHALSDDLRKDYLEAFRAGNYKYVVTIRESYENWEPWIRRANWFFYRELVMNYTPVNHFSYGQIWQRNDTLGISSNVVETKVEYELIPITSNRMRVEFTTPETGASLLADVCISFESGFTENRWRDLAIKRVVGVHDLYGHDAHGPKRYTIYTLNPNIETQHIMVRIVDGAGYFELASYPEKSTYLNLKSVRIEKLMLRPAIT